MVDENSKATNRHNKKLDSEAVVISIIGGLELHVDQVHCGICAGNVDHLTGNTEQLVNTYY